MGEGERVPTTSNPESAAAAASILPHRQRLMARVLGCVAESGSRGVTCDDVERITGLAHQTVSPRVNELGKSGLIVDSGERRPTRSGRKAAVWVLPVSRALAGEVSP